VALSGSDERISVLLPPTFPGENFCPGDDAFARLLAPDLEVDLVLDVIGRNWRHMTTWPDHPELPIDIDTRAWFSRGDPTFVVVGLGEREIEVWRSGVDVQYFNVDDQEQQVALIPRGMHVGGVLRIVAKAIDDTAALEQAERTWCRQCGRFAASSREGSDGLCFDCTHAWLHGTVF
jgi:hypothetical protein